MNNVKIQYNYNIYIMTNILFILFLGNGENIKIWNENTKSKFLDRLKTLGDVYVYQDKSYNIIHYDLSDKYKETGETHNFGSRIKYIERAKNIVKEKGFTKPICLIMKI